MRINSEESAMVQVMLGPCHKGPSISVQDGQFVLHTCGDKLLTYDIFVKADTLDGLIKEMAKMPLDKRKWKPL